MAEQAGLSLTLSETPNTGYLVLWPKFGPAHKTMVSQVNSFLPSTLRDRNSLDLNHVRNAPALSNFKRQVNHTLNKKTYPNTLDTIHSTRTGQIHHSKMGLQCSSLKYYLYKKNIVQDSLCGAIETTFHYLLHVIII